jgi:hypothetical protein
VSTAGTSSGWCGACYEAGITRLCEGFAIVKPGGRAAVAVPPLGVFLAAGVRKAARVVLDDRGPGSAGRHGEHVKPGTGRERVRA